MPSIFNRPAITRAALTAWVLLVLVAAPAAWGSSGCDKALAVYWKGRYSPDNATAEKYYELAIKMCPGFIRPHELLGDIRRKRGRKEAAIKSFTAAARLGSTNYKLYYLLAQLLFEEGKPDEAKEQLDLSLELRSDYPKALELKGKIERALDKSGPQIILFEPAAARGITVIRHFGSATVRGLATDKSGVAWVRVNGEDALADTRGNFLKDVALRAGKNLIAVTAADRLGNRSTIEVAIERAILAAPQEGGTFTLDDRQPFYNRSHAIVIGIDRYDHWPPLESAASDARAMAGKLAQSGFDRVTTILNEEATQRRILTELFHSLPREVDPQDRVLFYFAGHGQTLELPNGIRRGYIVPQDAERDDLPGSAISMEQIKSLSRRIRAKHIIYIVDSCYSGLGLNRSLGTSPGGSGFLKKVASMRAVQIVTAGGKGEQAQEREGHGVFTEFVLKALDGNGDLDHDGVVTGTELGTYLRPRVSDATGNAQTPLFGRLEGEGDFLFFISHAPR